MSKVALVIIFNHQYIKNIEILEKIYKERFSHIYHLVPFYRGQKSNVIPVYENSFFFQGYLAQSMSSIFSQNYDHYFFIADDLFLNPLINENNYTKYLHLNQNTCFLPGFISLHNKKEWWSRVFDAFNYTIDYDGVEIANELPDFDEALKLFSKFGLEIQTLKFDQIWKRPITIKDFGRTFIRDRNYFIRKLVSLLIRKSYELKYPLVGSYSDIFVVSSDAIKQFSHVCGVFAASRLFVEIGLPTALVLTAKEIVTEVDLPLQGLALWTEDDFSIIEKYSNSLNNLLINFPKNHLYLHPIKLSKWEM